MNAPAGTWHTSDVAEIRELRDLPAVDEIIAGLGEVPLPRPLVVDAVRTSLDVARSEIRAGSPVELDGLIADHLRHLTLGRTRPVINATGVLLHTNLGRAPLSERAVEAMTLAAGSYTNVEFDIAIGERGGRGRYVAGLLTALTGAEDALVVNNNAAAVLLAMAATSHGKAVPVARGELIEIGGSYRLPTVMEASGARLVEVGTTNRTRVGDYETAIQLHDTGAILKVHPSNYRVEGFTEEASLEDLVSLAHTHGLSLIHDIGSGLLDAGVIPAPAPQWLEGEPSVTRSVAEGVDLVTFSGDKLLGGPQAGIVVGSAEALAPLRKHPLNRALRVDGPTLAALAATLEAYADGNLEEIPFWRMAMLHQAGLRSRLERIQWEVGGGVRDGESVVGAGSAPGTGIRSPQLVLSGEDHLFELLLAAEHSVATRRADGDLIIDLRAVDPSQDEVITRMVSGCR